ncbi:HEAT repeat domain-containing protein [Sphingobacterium faecium]|uniref:HEAT repeat domain-containing protein n=1 Tax=Sphingobacterium faecium TaxID=34087 RepID=UPI003209E60C
MKKERIIQLEMEWAEILKGPQRSNPAKISNKKITASELQTELLYDEEYQKWLKDKNEIKKNLEEAYSEDARPLIDDLKKVGINIKSIWDLVNTKLSYKPAIPVLIEHLSKPYHLKNKEGIIRALAVKEAKGVACRAIIDEYNKGPKTLSTSYRWVFGNTMVVIITPEYVDDVIAIVSDKSNGISREMFVIALAKVRSEKTENLLISLLEDEDVVLSALEALGMMKSKKAIDKILMLTNHSKSEVKKIAKKILKKLC